MSVSSRSSDRDETELISDDTDSPLLYDILVYREWPPQPDPKTSESSLNGDSAVPATEGWRSKLSSWVKWSGKVVKSFLLWPNDKRKELNQAICFD